MSFRSKKRAIAYYKVNNALTFISIVVIIYKRKRCDVNRCNAVGALYTSGNSILRLQLECKLILFYAIPDPA